MTEAEGTSTTVVTAAELKDLFGQGTPSLRAVSTPGAQTAIDGYFDAFGAAAGKTWTPADAEQDGGAPSGGKYEETFYFSSTGLDLREAADKTLLGGALYNHVLGIIAQQITTEAAIDRLLAAFGASTALSNRTDLDGSVDEDRLIAGHASRRDATATPEQLGPYRKIKTALLTMKAALPGGEGARPISIRPSRRISSSGNERPMRPRSSPSMRPPLRPPTRSRGHWRCGRMARRSVSSRVSEGCPRTSGRSRTRRSMR